MFRELMPLIQHRPLTLTVAAINEQQIRVNIVPKVAPIAESSIAALTTRLSLTRTPDEIDAQLAKTLTEFTVLRVRLQNTLLQLNPRTCPAMPHPILFPLRRLWRPTN